MQSFPTSAPEYPDTIGSEKLGLAGSGKGLSAILDDYGLDITAIASKLGISSSTPSFGKVLRATGTGQSAWGKIIINTDVDTFSSADLSALLTDETGTGLVVFGTTPTIVTPKIDTINESTNNNGVTVDGLNIKDSKLNTNDSVVTANITNSAVTTAKIADSSVTTIKIADNAVTAPKVVGLDKSNLTTDSNPYKFSVYRSTTQSLTTGGTRYTVAFDTETFDTNGNFSSNTYTAPVTGFYFLSSCVTINNGAGAAYWNTFLYKNGTTDIAQTQSSTTSGAGNHSSIISGIFLLNAGDTVVVQAQYGINTTNVAAGLSITFFTGYLISRT